MTSPCPATISPHPKGGDCTISARGRQDGAPHSGGDARALARVVARLRHPSEIRTRCHELLARGERGALAHFDVRTDRLSAVARLVARITRERYPNLSVPAHSRWRHFGAGGIDRWGRLAAGMDPDERARAAFDLVLTSVLLDAGAGDAWRYRERTTGREYARSEGLAVASFALFAAGGFSSDPARPLRADADALRAFDAACLAAGFQASAGNPLAGLEGRAHLLRALGEAVAARSDLFGAPPRVGGLFDHFRTRARTRPLSAPEVLGTLLDAFAPIWPGRIDLGGTNLGDVWRHRAIVRDDASNALIPFHKLSQWLTYSLAETLAGAGYPVESLEELTGLAEYRNGGLFIDGGVLAPRDSAILDTAHRPEAEIVVEWRALTLALLDRLAPLVRDELGADDEKVPLASVLEGGTWAAGRRLAQRARKGGGPPIRIVSDGTVF